MSRAALALQMLICAGAMISIATVEADAGSSYCGDLQGQYLAILRESGSSRGGFNDLSRRLATAEAAAQSRNCGQRFFFFGPPESADCPAIMATIDRLQQQTAGIRDQGFGLLTSNPDFDPASLRAALIENGCDIPTSSSGRSRTLCVRLCDGYYFPISNASSRSRQKIDAAVCQSMYAADGQAELYVQPAGSDVDQATSLNGKRYADQPFAFQYRDSFDASCHAELKTGLAALGVRDLRAPIAENRTVALSGTTLETISAVGVEEDPGSRRGTGFEGTSPPAGIVPIESIVPPERKGPVRLVGDTYYFASLMSPIPLRRGPAKHLSLSTVDTPGSPASAASTQHASYGRANFPIPRGPSAQRAPLSTADTVRPLALTILARYESYGRANFPIPGAPPTKDTQEMRLAATGGSEDRAELRALVGILAIIAMLVLALGIGLRFFRSRGTPSGSVTIEAGKLRCAMSPAMKATSAGSSSPVCSTIGVGNHWVCKGVENLTCLLL